MKKNYIKKDIIKILDKHPEALTLTELARRIKVSNLTLTKYAYELIGEGKIHVRMVGSAKLCYLKKWW